MLAPFGLARTAQAYSPSSPAPTLMPAPIWQLLYQGQLAPTSSKPSPAPPGDLLINICTTLPPSPLHPAKPSRVAAPPHLTLSSARVARGPCARAKNSGRRERRFSAVTLVCRSLKSGCSHSQNRPISPNRPGNCRKSDETTEPRGHSRPRLANRVGVMVAPSNSDDCRPNSPIVPAEAWLPPRAVRVGATLRHLSVSKTAYLLTKSPS